MKTLSALALSTFLLAPVAAFADVASTSADDELRSTVGQSDVGMGENQAVAPQMNRGGMIKAHVVDIGGNRLVAETEKGELMVFLVDGPIGGLNIGDELELKLDEEKKSAEILKVRPHEGQPAS